MFDNKEFDKQFNRITKLSIAGVIASIVISLSFLALIIWAVVSVVNHFF